jgi:sugar lactone lactonase YvrE
MMRFSMFRVVSKKTPVACALLVAGLVSTLMTGAARADVLLYVNSATAGTISKVSSTGVVTPFVSGLTTPGGMAFDSSQNLYVSTGTTVSKISPGGSVSTFVSGQTDSSGLAFDASGNLYVASSTGINKVTPGGSVSQFAVGNYYGLAFDTNGDLFASNLPSTIVKILPNGTVSTFYSGLSEPLGMAFDASGNLYVESDLGVNQGIITKITPGGAASTFASGLAGTSDGLVIDGSGNIYLANNPGSISKFTPPSGIPSTFASGLNGADSMVLAPVPEPSCIALMAMGGLALLALRRRPNRG